MSTIFKPRFPPILLHIQIISPIFAEILKIEFHDTEST